MKVRWTSKERELVANAIKADKEDVNNLPKGVTVGLTDVYFDYVQERCLPSHRWIDWRDNVSVNPDIAACFGKKYAAKVRVTRMGKPKVIENLEREIEQGKQQATRDLVVSAMLEQVYVLAEKARAGDERALSQCKQVGVLATIENSVVKSDEATDDQEYYAIEGKYTGEVIGYCTSEDKELVLERSDTGTLRPISRDRYEAAVNHPPKAEIPKEVETGPSATTLALRQISQAKTKLLVVGCLTKHQSQVEQALLGNNHIELVFQPRCRDWKNSVNGVTGIMMSTLCDGQAMSAARQFCKAHGYAFEPAGTGKTAIISWVARMTGNILRVDGRWLRSREDV